MYFMSVSAAVKLNCSCWLKSWKFSGASLSCSGDSQSPEKLSTYFIHFKQKPILELSIKTKPVWLKADENYFNSNIRSNVCYYAKIYICMKNDIFSVGIICVKFMMSKNMSADQKEIENKNVSKCCYYNYYSFDFS